jgi:hypothetical protein
VYKTSQQVADSIKIDLLDSLKSVINSTYTDSLGFYSFKNLETGEYNLFTEDNGPIPLMITKILVEESQDKTINFTVCEPCQNNSINGVCPHCNSSRKVLKIAQGTVVQPNFGRNKRAAKRYDKKNLRKGFRTYINDELEQVVINMYINTERDKFYDFCHHWFCVKCKKVF